MDIPQRPSLLHYIVIRGQVFAAALEFTYPIYGLKFYPSAMMGDKVLVLDYKTNTYFLTEEGLLIGEYKSFLYPKQKEELLKELCYESKRRFEESIKSTIKTW